MSIQIAKYIFWILISFPILIFGAYFFLKLYKDNFVMNRIDEKKKKEAEMERIKYNQFQESYKKEHPGEY